MIWCRYPHAPHTFAALGRQTVTSGSRLTGRMTLLIR